jgi:RNA polymerase sigma-70 factor (ECF subfamily)
MVDVATVEPYAADGLVRLAASGDEAAFTRLVMEHHERMARVAYVICGDQEVARDAVQAAWTTAWRRLGSLREPGQVGPWLVAIAANEARQAMRRGRRGPRIVELAEADELVAPGDPTGRIGMLDLERALDRLGADDRALIALRFVAGLDSSEIAIHLAMTPSGVRSRLARLLDRLRTELHHD